MDGEAVDGEREGNARDEAERGKEGTVGGIGEVFIYGTSPFQPNTMLDDPYPNETEHVRSMVARYFSIYEVKSEADAITFFCHVYPDLLEENFEMLRKDLWNERYIPFLDKKGEEYTI
ncbi:MAG: hypothetical protein KAT70_03560, partial [Thermoplasmata archaeon]|nr:hypothetical protein [Thermoplasmata archaeon]